MRSAVIVSIHARVERATTKTYLQTIDMTRFNPRTRRACDITLFNDNGDGKVSIHARVERATTVREDPGALVIVVSIHARVERATQGRV